MVLALELCDLLLARDGANHSAYVQAATTSQHAGLSVLFNAAG